MNKVGGEQIISVYWFAILFIVAGAVVYMVAVFYGSPFDVRETEAQLIINKISTCISNGGMLEDNVFNQNFQNNFLNECDLNFDVEDFDTWNNSQQYYVKVKIYDFDETQKNLLGNLATEFSAGNFQLRDFCEQDGNLLPVCVERAFYSLDQNKKQYIVKIKSIVRKTEKNAQ